MSEMHPLAIVNATSITSLVRITLYHHSTSVYHTKAETNEGVIVLGEKVRNGAAENPVIAPYRAAARSDNHEQPCVTDGPRSDS